MYRGISQQLSFPLISKPYYISFMVAKSSHNLTSNLWAFIDVHNISCIKGITSSLKAMKKQASVSVMHSTLSYIALMIKGRYCSNDKRKILI